MNSMNQGFSSSTSAERKNKRNKKKFNKYSDESSDDINSDQYENYDDDPNYLIFKKEIKKEEILDQLFYLYNEVIVRYNNYQLDIYKPNIFSNITQENFIEWAIDSNQSIQQLFEI